MKHLDSKSYKEPTSIVKFGSRDFTIFAQNIEIIFSESNLLIFYLFFLRNQRFGLFTDPMVMAV